MSLAAALLAADSILVILLMSSASAAACATAWNASTAYQGGAVVSYHGHNWSAKWWTQSETPGNAGVWADQGTCGGGAGHLPRPATT